jgi:nucleoid-associated protein YgaU
MTSDAKVGLLLGLVFIFIIAFVINGLPRFRSAVNEAQATTNMAVGDDNYGITGKESKALEAMDWGSIENSPAAEQQATENTTSSNNPSNVITQNNDSGNELSTDSQPDTANNDGELDMFTRFRVRLQNNPFEGQPSEPASSSNNVAQNNQTTQTAVPAQQNVQPAQTQSNNKKTSLDLSQYKTYVVGSGESLSSIAKKFYGTEEGNKISTIQELYEANRDILKSVDSVVSGQKIVIPDLPSTPMPVLPTKTQPEKVLTGPQFANVKYVGNPIPDTGRWYEVKGDDNLWKIASEQLGKGSRYTELIKLNTDKISEDGKLKPGTRLRLPAK